MVVLQDLLINEYGLAESLEGYHLTIVRDVTDDGRFMVGNSMNPAGVAEAWLLDFGPPAFLPGDYNNNGLVEQGDLDLVLANWGADATTPPANWTHDLPTGNIDQEELDRVLANWGNTTSAVSTAAVPGPGTVMLLMIGLAGLLAHKHHRCRGRHNAA